MLKLTLSLFTYKSASMKFKILYKVLFFILVSIASALSQEVIKYEGDLIGVKSKIRIGVDIDFQLISITLSSSLGIKNLPMQIIKFDSDSIIFENSTYGVYYYGAIAGDKNIIYGQWEQNKIRYRLDLKKVITEEISDSDWGRFVEKDIEITSGEIRLGASITIPKPIGRYKAIIMLGVAGATDRDMTYGNFKPFKSIAHQFSNEGYVVVRLDDRGVGKSNGSLHQASYSDLKNDILAVRDYLKRMPIVDTHSIGLFGISEGAALACELAAENKFDFAILISFPAMSGLQTIYRQINDLSAEYKFSSDKKKMVLSEFQSIHAGLHQDTLLVQSISNRSNEVKKLLSYFMVPTDNKQAYELFNSPWYRSQLKFDPFKALQTIRCPTLFLYGKKDPFVNYRYHVPVLKKALKKNSQSRTSIKIFKNVNHIFQDSKSGSPLQYVSNENDFSAAAFMHILNWVTNKL